MTDTFTQETFAVDLLNSIGAPTTPANIAFIERWENIEGGHWHNPASYNPLNTTLKEPGSVPFAPGASVQAYPSAQIGEQAASATLLEPQYAGVVSGLRASDVNMAAQSLVQSPWDAEHYGYNASVFTSGTPTVDTTAVLTKATTTTQADNGGNQSVTSSKSAPRILASLNDALQFQGGVTGALNVKKDASVIIARIAVVGIGVVIGTTGLLLLFGAAIAPTVRTVATVPNPAQPIAKTAEGVSNAIEAKATEVAA